MEVMLGSVGMLTVLLFVVTVGLTAPATSGSGAGSYPVLDPVGADLPTSPPRGETWDVYGEVRFRFDYLPDFATDAQGTQTGRDQFAAIRLLVGAALDPSAHVDLALEIEALNATVMGFSPLGTSWSNQVFRPEKANIDGLKWVLPRKANVRFAGPWGRLVIGTQGFNWGTGMWLNDGAHQPDFGDARQGAVVARLGVLGTPFMGAPHAPPAARGLVFFGAGDVILRDDTLFAYQGDLGVQGTLGVRWTTPRLLIGAMAMARWERPNQTRDQEERLVFPVDLHIKGVPVEGLTLEGETTFISGSSERAESDVRTPIRAWGGLARVRYDHTPLRITAKLEAGLATGSGSTFTSFHMASDHNVGLVLFEQVLPMVSARQADLQADSDTAGSIEVNPGAVTDAVYLYPFFEWRPIKLVDLRVGYVYARSMADSVELGHEVDGAISLNLGLPLGIGVGLMLEGGVWVPTHGLDALPLDPLYTLRGGAQITW